MQFAAIAVLLEDGSAFLSFRGTDATLVGWKEDFSMSFLDAVPAQQAALDYVEPVSYTHLDVYKRKLLVSTDHCLPKSLAAYCPPWVRK